MFTFDIRNNLSELWENETYSYSQQKFNIAFNGYESESEIKLELNIIGGIDKNTKDLYKKQIYNIINDLLKRNV